MGERISKILKGQGMTSVIYILLGLCLVAMPVKTVNIICKVVFGVIMIATGLFHIYIHLREKPGATVLDLFSGSILLALGIFLFFNPQIVVKILPILLGTFILVDSIWTLQGAFKLKKRRQEVWKLLLAGSVIFVGLGIALVLNPFTAVKYTMMFAGWILLCNGILDVVFLILIPWAMKRPEKETESALSKSEASAKEEGVPGAAEAEAEPVQSDKLPTQAGELPVLTLEPDLGPSSEESQTESMPEETLGPQEPLEEWKD